MEDLRNFLTENGMSLMGFCSRFNIQYASLKKYLERGSNGVRITTLRKIENAVKEIKKEKQGIYVRGGDYKPCLMPIDDLWKYLPNKLNYISQDKNGDFYAYESEPSLNRAESRWETDKGMVSKLPMMINNGGLEWFESLCKRPINYWNYIGKYGLFADDDDLNIMFGKLTGITEDNKFQKNDGFTYANFRPLTDGEKEMLA